MTSARADEDSARFLAPGEALPMGATPVVIADTTVSNSVCVEHLLRDTWSVHLPRPWLVLVADAPAPPPVAARYRIRAASAATVPSKRGDQQRWARVTGTERWRAARLAPAVMAVPDRGRATDGIR
ncbi:hypothetical protein ACFQ78_27610 [Streptomyces sp. NPDC056519]|uniref:hypothetical protein n=1 Tax=Streptomyces sp. NPDC056519 TaxID=3345849 RepID=UPI0036CDE09E